MSQGEKPRFALWDLSDDVLECIVAFAATDSAFKLWKCGCMLLNLRLQRTIKEIGLADRLAGTTTRWPRRLPTFRLLRKLVLARDMHRLDTLPNLRNGITSLPSTLEHLEISCMY